MTEKNHGPAGSPADDGPVPGFGRDRHDEEPGAAPADGPPRTVFDQEIPAPETPADNAETGDRRVAGPSAPGDDQGRQGGWASPEKSPSAAAADDQGQRGGWTSPESGPPADDEAPARWAAAEHGQPPAQHGAVPADQAPGDGRHRPAFVPYNQPPAAAPYGWPQHGHGQPPPAPPGPPHGGPPPAPPGPRPMAGYGQPPGGPNWAPVPPVAREPRRGPGLGLLVLIVAIVGLVSAGVGAGIAVLATDRDSGTVSLGGSPGAGPAAKNRPPDSVAGIAQKVLPSVVMIRVSGGGEQGAGTGFIVKNGYIVTNNHVAAPGANGQIQVIFNDKKTLTAKIVGNDPSSDIAVLKVDGAHSLPALTPGNSDELAVGDPVIAIGSPLGLQGSVTTGIVSSMNRAVPTRGDGGDTSFLNAIQTDAAINPGNSGGPLVDARGNVIGINTAIATVPSQGLGGGQAGNIGLGFAIPINQGIRVAEEIINTGSVKQAKMGVIPDPQSQNGAKILDREIQGQKPVTPGGPADKAGLKPGDVITKVDDRPIEDASDLIALIRSKAPGAKIKVTFQRGGQEQTVEVTLEAG
ncbi:trypsin-like peptidase domain-containing protein [Actinomadura flavalba]|uniref:trypsin-like peptidase domain-containing protein n=1 Tax=Actinomadura flavalba TaxID=1120938 RepID=UPI00035C86D9|nr:trypsin-like peptidase domain-containing protein [Actinomadura flavalba]